MGGLHKWLPITHRTFAAATAAIIGFPLTSGFFSKDEILYRAEVDHMVNPMEGKGLLKGRHLFEPPMWLGPVLYTVAVVAAAMTAFYMCRLYFLTFWGSFRGWTVGRPSLLARQELEASHGAADDHGHDAHGDDDDEEEAHAHHHEDLSTPGYPPHESPWQMTVPLIILAAFAVGAGFLNPGFGLSKQPLEHWLEPVFREATEGAVQVGTTSMSALALGGISAFLVGTAIAYWMYIANRGKPAESLAAAMPGLHQMLLDKWRVDELYEAVPIAAVDSLAETSAAVDKGIVDGLLAQLTSLVVAASGTILRTFQNGVVHAYAAMMVLGIAGVGLFFGAPHPRATITEAGSDDFVVTAAPGVGYSYRWDSDGDGTPDKPDFGPTSTLKLHLEPGKTATVKLEVKNAFGLVRSRSIPVARPAAQLGATSSLSL
jgi:NADH-quinone oxidoreductase subunit L